MMGDNGGFTLIRALVLHQVAVRSFGGPTITFIRLEPQP